MGSKGASRRSVSSSSAPAWRRLAGFSPSGQHQVTPSTVALGSRALVRATSAFMRGSHCGAP